LDQDVEDVLAHAAHRQDRPQGQHREERRAGDPPGPHPRRTSRPPGRTNIITMNTTNAITYPISVEITTPPIEMISLMTTEATKAPTMFPRPPSTQIMKVRGPNAAPKNGCTEYWMMGRAPASPAIAPPTAEVTKYTRCGLAPISAIASRSWETARIAVPM